MAKTTAPLLSFDGAGQIAKTQVYSRWRGIPYVRRYVVPANPRTDAQMQTRDIFRTLNSMWLFAPALLQAPWDAQAQGRPYLGRNKFIGDNMRSLRQTPPATDMADWIASPGARGGLPPSAVVPTPAANQISFAVDLPDEPVGWTLTQSVGAVFRDQDPETLFPGPIIAASDAVTPEDLIIPGLLASTDYAYGVWLQWLKPNGDIAYSVSLGGVATTTA